MFSSLRFRTAAAYVLLIIAAFSALGALIATRFERDFRTAIVDDLESQARMIASLARPLFESQAPSPEFDALAKQLGEGVDTRVTLIDVSGRVLGDSEADPALTDNHANRPEVLEAVRSGSGSSARRSETVGRELTYVAVTVETGDSVTGIVRVARPSSAVNAALARITQYVLISIAVTAGLAAALSLLLSATVLRPLGRLAEATRTLAGGNLRERIKPRPAGEVGELADAFNQMAESLETLIDTSTQERNRLVAVLNSSADAVIAVDRQDRVAFANLAADRLFGRRPAELAGNPFVWVMPNEALIEALHASRDEGRRSITTIERPRNEFLQVITTPISAGGDWASLVVFHDLTDVKRTEQMRRDFVANVSHEFRTPLAAIKSVLETLEGGALEDRRVAGEFLSQANAEVDRLAMMVEELLELSRIEAGEAPLRREPADLGEITRRAVSRLAPQTERALVRLELQVEPGVPLVLGDAERLERAVVNLVHNALKFTPAGGDVLVSVRAAEGSVEVQVADSGIGIPQSQLSRVFERFYKVGPTRAEEGTGLGLALVKHTVEAHGGNVRAESEEGRGSTFAFNIPVSF